jgi:hypothetical protein
MRIIDTDNYSSDYPNEHFWFGIFSPEHAKVVCEGLNKTKPLGDARYFQIVSDDYVLQPGFEP